MFRAQDGNDIAQSYRIVGKGFPRSSSKFQNNERITAPVPREFNEPRKYPQVRSKFKGFTASPRRFPPSNHYKVVHPVPRSTSSSPPSPSTLHKPTSTYFNYRHDSSSKQRQLSPSITYFNFNSQPKPPHHRRVAPHNFESANSRNQDFEIGFDQGFENEKRDLWDPKHHVSYFPMNSHREGATSRSYDFHREPSSRQQIRSDLPHLTDQSSQKRKFPNESDERYLKAHRIHEKQKGQGQTRPLGSTRPIVPPPRFSSHTARESQHYSTPHQRINGQNVSNSYRENSRGEFSNKSRFEASRDKRKPERDSSDGRRPGHTTKAARVEKRIPPRPRSVHRTLPENRDEFRASQNQSPLSVPQDSPNHDRHRVSRNQSPLFVPQDTAGSSTSNPVIIDDEVETGGKSSTAGRWVHHVSSTTQGPSMPTPATATPSKSAHIFRDPSKHQNDANQPKIGESRPKNDATRTTMDEQRRRSLFDGPPKDRLSTRKVGPSNTKITSKADNQAIDQMRNRQEATQQVSKPVSTSYSNLVGELSSKILAKDRHPADQELKDDIAIPTSTRQLDGKVNSSNNSTLEESQDSDSDSSNNLQNAMMRLKKKNALNKNASGSDKYTSTELSDLSSVAEEVHMNPAYNINTDAGFMSLLSQMQYQKPESTRQIGQEQRIGMQDSQVQSPNEVERNGNFINEGDESCKTGQSSHVRDRQTVHSQLPLHHEVETSTKDFRSQPKQQERSQNQSGEFGGVTQVEPTLNVQENSAIRVARHEQPSSSLVNGVSPRETDQRKEKDTSHGHGPMPFDKITSDDMMALHLREEGRSWKDIYPVWQVRTGNTLTLSALQKRCARVRKTIDKDAGSRPSGSTAKSGVLNQGGDSPLFVPQEDESENIGSLENGIQSGPDKDLKSKTSRRPTTGGKHLSTEENNILIESLAKFKVSQVHFDEVDEEIDEEEGSPEREESPVVEEDACHFLYFVKRKVIRPDEIEDDAEWMHVGKNHSTILAANREAATEVTLLRGDGDIWPLTELNCQCIPEYGDMVRWKGTSEHGTILVHVDRKLRAFHEGIMPESKNGWLKKVVYDVWIRTTDEFERNADAEKKSYEVSTNQDNAASEVDLQALEKLLNDPISEMQLENHYTDISGQDQSGEFDFDVDDEGLFVEHADEEVNEQQLDKLQSTNTSQQPTTARKSVPSPYTQESKITTISLEPAASIFSTLDAANRAAAKIFLQKKSQTVPKRDRKKIDVVLAAQQAEKDMEERLQELEETEVAFQDQLEIISNEVDGRGRNRRRLLDIYVVERKLEGPRNI